MRGQGRPSLDGSYRCNLPRPQETGRHPVTGDELKKEDLITLQTNKVVHPAQSGWENHACGAALPAYSGSAASFA